MKIKSFDRLFESINLKLYKGAGEYGDSHPKGTFLATDIDFKKAKEISTYFKMKSINAPDNYTIDSIESEGREDMSVGTFSESEYRFIYLVKNFQGLYDLYVGPKSVEVVKSFLTGNISKDDIDLSDLEDFFTDFTDSSYNFEIEYVGTEELDGTGLEGYVISIISPEDLLNSVRYMSIDSWEQNLKYQVDLIKCIKNLASQKELRIIYIEKTDRNTSGHQVDPYIRVVLAR